MAMQLIPLHTRSINEQTLDTVNARELHTFLEVGRYFANWIKVRIDKYGFVEGEDFTVISRLPNSASGNRGATKEYFVTLDMAKELAMVERNEKGKPAATSSSAKNNSTSKNTFLQPPRTRPLSKQAFTIKKSTNSSTT